MQPFLDCLQCGSKGAPALMFYDFPFKVRNTLHPTPYTLHPTPYTLHRGSGSVDSFCMWAQVSQCSTVNIQKEVPTLHPKP